jgi:hypothetical protein
MSPRASAPQQQQQEQEGGTAAVPAPTYDIKLAMAGGAVPLAPASADSLSTDEAKRVAWRVALRAHAPALVGSTTEASLEKAVRALGEEYSADEGLSQVRTIPSSSSV